VVYQVTILIKPKSDQYTEIEDFVINFYNLVIINFIYTKIKFVLILLYKSNINQ